MLHDFFFKKEGGRAGAARWVSALAADARSAEPGSTSGAVPACWFCARQGGRNKPGGGAGQRAVDYVVVG